MARKPAHLELIGGKGLRQRIWDRVRALRGADFRLLDVVIGSEVNETAREYLLGLERAGYLAVTQKPGRNLPKRWRLANDVGVEAPRVRRDGTPVTMGLAQEQMWRTLRMQQGDTNARELAAHASTPAVPVRESAAADYLRHLHCANYLRETQRGHGIGHGGVQARYQLISNTGPRPPMVCRADTLYDPNLGKTVWVRPVTEEDAIYGR